MQAVNKTDFVLKYWACNQKTFKAEEVSWNQCTSINISSKTQKMACREKIWTFFSQILLKTTFRTKSLTQTLTQSGLFFLSKGTFFDFQKRVGETPSFTQRLRSQVLVLTISNLFRYELKTMDFLALYLLLFNRLACNVLPKIQKL